MRVFVENLLFFKVLLNYGMNFFHVLNYGLLQDDCFKFFKSFFSVFSEYAIVRTSFVCLSVCLSVCRPRYYFSWGCPIKAIYGSIDSLWPKDPNDGRNFFWTGPGPDGRGQKSKFRIFSYKNWILLVFKKGY
jgi:hypothetical protein